MNNKKPEINDIYKLGYQDDYPVSITIELNTICNWRCLHCYIPKHSNAGLSTNVIKNIIIQSRRIGGFDLVLTGGEVMLRKDLIEIITFARKLGMSVSLLSNASLLNEDMVIELKKLNIRSFSSTIFSLDSKIHDSITQVSSSLSNALRGINLLEKYNIPVELKTPILNKNSQEYLDVEKYASDNGFSYTCSPCIFPRTDGSKTPVDYILNKKKLKKEISNIDQLNNYKPLEYKLNDDICTVLRYSLFIASNGDLYPCGSFPLKMGNVLESKVLDIWNHPQYKRIRTMKRSQQHKCMDCDLSSLCNSCPGISYLETGEYLECSEISKSIAEAREQNI